MNINKLQNNLFLLSVRNKNELAIDEDGTIVDKKSGMSRLSSDKFAQLVHKNYEQYRSMNRPLWVEISQTDDGKLLGAKADDLFHRLMRVSDFEQLEPIPVEECEEHDVVTFMAQNGGVQADRNLLMESSPFFERMLVGPGFIEQGQDVIELKMIDIQHLKAYVDFIHGREPTPITPDNPAEIGEWFTFGEMIGDTAFLRYLHHKLYDISDLNLLIANQIDPESEDRLPEQIFVDLISLFDRKDSNEVRTKIMDSIQNLEDIGENQENILLLKRSLVSYVNVNQVKLCDKIFPKEMPLSDVLAFLEPVGESLEYADFKKFYYFEWVDGGPKQFSAGYDFNNNSLEKLVTMAPNLKHLMIDQDFASILERNALRLLRPLKDLETLNISGCSSLDPDSLSEISQLKKLKNLNIDFCKFTSLEPIQDLDLKVLSARCSSLDPNTLEVITGFQSLESLSLSCGKFDPESFHLIGKLTHLRILELEGIPSDLVSVEFLSHLKHLERLHFGSYRPEEDNWLIHIKDLVQLRDLSIPFTAIHKNGLKPLSKLIHLEHLNLESVYTNGDAYFLAPLINLTNLKDENVYRRNCYCYPLSDLRRSYWESFRRKVFGS